MMVRAHFFEKFWKVFNYFKKFQVLNFNVFKFEKTVKNRLKK